MRVVCDLGGTHIRFGLSDGTGTLDAPQKFSAADFTGFHDAVSYYVKLQGLKVYDGILIASTGPLSRPWPVENESLRANGLNILAEVNDFEASAWGATQLSGEQLLTLRHGIPGNDDPRVILGPGTGLGLAYMLPLGGGRWRIQKTHGGHMLAAVLTKEHQELARLIADSKGSDHTIIYENFIGGRGLPLLYRAVCKMQNDAAYDVHSAADLLALDDSPARRTTLRIFHEMLGLFAHHCVLTVNAFGGLYLDGGMVQRLMEGNLFDQETVLRFMTLNPVATVRADLDRTPVWVVNDPFIALRGLVHMDGVGLFPDAIKKEVIEKC